MSRVAAIVLAAGSSSRLGQPKQLLPHANGSLVENAVTAAKGSNCDPIIVVTGAVDEPIRQRLAGRAIVTHNANWSAGMGGSIAIGMTALLQVATDVQRALVLVCDQPNLNAIVLTALLAAWRAGDHEMAACRYADALGPPCGFDQSHFDELLGLPPERGAKSLLQPIDAVTVLDWPEGSLDVDTPEDLRRWNRRLSEG